MRNQCYVTIATVFFAALFGQESSASACTWGDPNCEWVQMNNPTGVDKNSLIAVSVNSGPSQSSVFYFVATSTGVYEGIVSTPQLSSVNWGSVGTLSEFNESDMRQITADSNPGGDLYLIDSIGNPLFYIVNGSLGQGPNYNHGPMGTIIGISSETPYEPAPGYPFKVCQFPTDIAVDEELNVYVVGCGNNSFWVAPHTGSNTWGRWASYAVGGAANLVAVGANANFAEQGPWVVDANGLTFQVQSNGNSAAIARPEWISNTAHSIGVYGQNNQATAIGGESEVCQWTSGSGGGWNCPFLGGQSVQISVQGYTVFVENSASNLFTYSNDIVF